MNRRAAERLAKRVERIAGDRIKVTVMLDGLGDTWLVRLYDRRTKVWTKCSSEECDAGTLLSIHDEESLDRAIWSGAEP